MSPVHYNPCRTLVGYNVTTFKGYHLYDPTSHQVTEYRDVIFDEPIIAKHNCCLSEVFLMAARAISAVSRVI